MSSHAKFSETTKYFLYLSEYLRKTINWINVIPGEQAISVKFNSLEMLKKATEIKKNNGYIIDSLGWAHYRNKNYLDAEKYLQQAVELMPLDPVINDHYADTLWMLNKDIQARYFWEQVLNLDTTEVELKTNIRKKMIFGINKNL